MTRPAADDAYAWCRRLARDHYENFPVASVLLPKALRDPVAAIYAFARTADDFADEHDLEDSTRLGLLQDYERRLEALRLGDAPDLPVFIALGRAVDEHGLPYQPFFDLLSAFRQDVIKKRYADFRELRDYCRRSADPVGRLLLVLCGRDTPENRTYSDHVCTALQLVNFLQDIGDDARKGRIYLPQDEMRAYGVTEEHLHRGVADPAWQALIEHQITRAENMLRAGAPLARALPGRFNLEIRFTVAGGLTVLRKLRRANRAGRIGGGRLRPWDWATILSRALRL